MFDKFDNRVRLSGVLTALTALRIGAGRATGVRGTDLPVVRDTLDRPYIPGSSLKGVLRASVESIVRAAAGEGRACDPLGEGCVSVERAQAWQQQVRRGSLTDAQMTGRIYDASCEVCRVFGSHWLAAKVSIRDLLVEESAWFGQYEVRNGVAIDRDTGTAADGKLYDFEVVPAGTRFSCEIVAENASDEELGLLMIGLRPFELGEAALGGARSRGLGLVKIDWTSRKQVGRAGLLEYLAGVATGDEIGEDKIKGWLGSMVARLKEVANA